MVDRFDVNGDGELDLDEWLELAAIMFLGKGEREIKNEAFFVSTGGLALCGALTIGTQRFDTDRKGYITAEDIKSFCDKSATSLPSAFEDMIAACKPAVEGRLSKDEFDSLFSALFPPQAS
jgi:hypothetical protein